MDYRECKHELVKYGVGVGKCKKCDVLIVSLGYLMYLQTKEDEKEKKKAERR